MPPSVDVPKRQAASNPFGNTEQKEEKPAMEIDPSNPYANEPPLLEGK